MAEPVKHSVNGKLEQTAQEDLEQLIETLHRSGTLRALNGLFGQLGEVTEMLVEPLNSPPGKNALGNLILMAKALGEVDPKRVQEIVVGVTDALQHSYPRRAPGIFHLLTMAVQRDTRRGLYLLINVLRVLGHETRVLALSSERERPRALPTVHRLASSHARG